MQWGLGFFKRLAFAQSLVCVRTRVNCRARFAGAGPAGGEDSWHFINDVLAKEMRCMRVASVCNVITLFSMVTLCRELPQLRFSLVGLVCEAAELRIMRCRAQAAKGPG